jgi:hypothetical protein
MYDFPSTAIKADSRDFLGRFREIVSDPLNLAIQRHPLAGFIEGDSVILHNGNRVPATGEAAYYGSFSQILIINRGVHEPLEEYVFQEVLKVLSPSPTMLELGAYWGHYSMWLKATRPQASVHMVEPVPLNIKAGKENFARNGFQGIFIESFVGNGHFKVDDYLYRNNIAVLDVLHSDIQGYELEMLEGATRSLAEQRVTYVFISTHSQQLHHSIVEALSDFGYRVEVSSDFDSETTSFDGFVFASNPSVKPVFTHFNPLNRLQILESTPSQQVQYIAKVIDRTAF